MDDLTRFCCLNSRCPQYGKRGAGNLTVTARYGADKARRMLRCRACKVRFSERKGTPLLGSHLPEDRAVAVLGHLAQGRNKKTPGFPGVFCEYAREDLNL